MTGLLLAVLLPAIQGSRAAARSAECQSHLHQLGVATGSFVSSRGAFPGAHGQPFSDLSTFLEIPSIRPDTNDWRDADLSVFGCPAEAHESLGVAYYPNYRINIGGTIELLAEPPGGVPYSGIAPRYWSNPILPRHVADGLSNTALFSERRLTPHEGVSSSPSDVRAFCERRPGLCTFLLPRTYFFGQEVEFAAACMDPQVRRPPDRFLPGAPPHYTSLGHEYDHLLPPNSNGCRLYALPKLWLTWTGHLHANPAGSYHAGGVNAVFCDGHVKFVTESVDRDVWRGLGTRSGGEAVPAQ